ncbi:hypothetical protein [Actinomadura violacea]|uniref:WD40 repeat domain-containing protein n=1 Tax=Actinomadura violacea TaxID=2819934 RepID=A0ABS3RSF9_9ACTN|nr:hypothetical protein [Actinomadura violacea]MBO2459701.1 hypothetical protein [Actinomadura violacea]
MQVTEREPEELTRIVEQWRTSGGKGRSRKLETADKIAEVFVRGKWLLDAARRAAGDDVDVLARLREGEFAEAVQGKLYASGAPYPFLARRLRAFLYAAETVRHRWHGRDADAERCLETALAEWAGADRTPAPVARAQVLDLVDLLAAAPDGPAPRTVQMSVPVRGRAGYEPVTLVAEAVDLPEGRPPCAWPCPKEMAFTEIDPLTCGEAAAVTVSPPDGPVAGVRWRLVAASGKGRDTVPRTPLAAPLAVLADALATGTRLDPALTVVARLDGGDRLFPVEDDEGLARFAEENGKRLILGREQAPEPRPVRARVMRLGVRAPQRLPAPDVATALRLARRRPSRRLRWATVGVVVALLAVAGGYALHSRGDSGKEAERQADLRSARGIAGEVAGHATAEPGTALLRALAAQRISSGSGGARSALLNAVYGDFRLRELLRGAPSPLRSLVMAADGRTVAAAGGTAEVAVWSLVAGAPQVPRKVATAGAVTALALAPDGRTLAYAGRSAGVRTVALAPAGRSGALPLPGRGATVRALSFSTNGKDLAAATGDGSLLWPGAAQKPPVRFAEGADVAALAFAPKGGALAQITAGGEASFWQRSGKAAERTGAIDLQSPGTGIVYDQDGKAAFAMTANGFISPLDARTGKRLRKPVFAAEGSRPLPVTDGTLWLAGEKGLVPVRTAGLLLDGEVSAAAPVVGEGAPVQGAAAVSGDGGTTVTPAGPGALAVHGQADRRMFKQWVAGASGVAVLPDSGKMLLLTGLFGKRAWLTVYDPSTGRADAEVSYPSKYSLSPGVLSARSKSAALVTADGHVLVWRWDGGRRLERIGDLRPPPGPAVRPKAALDEDRGRLYVSWADRLVTYAYDGTAPPREVSERTLADPLACLAVDAQRARVVGCTRTGMIMWPLDRGGRAGRPVPLGSHPAVLAVVVQDGTVVAAGPGGDVFAYDVRDRQVKERALPGESMYVGTLTAVGNDAVLSARTGYIDVIDVRSAERLLRVRYPEPADPPLATWQDTGGLHFALGFAAMQLDMVLDAKALAARACRMGGWRGVSPTVGDAVPDAPQRLRDRPLCPMGG